MFLDTITVNFDIDEEKRILERESDIFTVILSDAKIDYHFRIERNGDLTKLNYVYNVINDSSRKNSEIYVNIDYEDGFLTNFQEDCIFFLLGELMCEYDSIKFLRSDIPTLNPKYFQSHLELW